MRSSAVAHQ